MMNLKTLKKIGGKVKRMPSVVLSKGLGVELYVEPRSSKARSNFNEEDILSQYIQKLNIQSHYVIDIAAGDGLTMSNTYGLFRSGWEGLAVEFDAEKFSKLAFRYKKFKGVNLAKCMVIPDNVQTLLSAYGVPQQFGVLSLDIDGYDYFVLDALLEKYRPSLMCVEINEKIPPPIQFTVKYDPKYQWAEDHFFGQSISQLHSLAGKYSYDLVCLEYNNAFLVAREINKVPSLTPEQAYKTGYLDRPNRKKLFAYNSDMEEIQQMTPSMGVDFLNKFFSKYAGKFNCGI